MKNKLERISNYIFYAGILVTAYGLYKTHISGRGLPPGACPIENNRPILYVAIGLLITSFILSLVYDRQKKKEERPK